MQGFTRNGGRGFIAFVFLQRNQEKHTVVLSGECSDAIFRGVSVV